MSENMDFCDKYLDVLQNIESAIIMVYNEFPSDFTDHDVSYALEALIDHYTAEKIGREPKAFSLDERPEVTFKLVKHFCDWRLGRKVMEIKNKLDEDEGVEVEKEPIDPEGRKTIDEIIQCLKTVLKSVHRWNKHYGRKGYLDFISQYIK